MKPPPNAPEPRIRHWWQAYPMAGLVVGWAAIGVIGWRVWHAVHGHPH